MGEIGAGTGRREHLREVGVFLVVSLAWATVRLEFNEEYSGASWAALLEFRAARPFGLRPLVPFLLSPFYRLGVSPDRLFFWSETVATFALLLVVRRVLRTWLHQREATAFALFLPGLLLPMYALQHQWPIYYPYDTPALLVVAIGVVFIVEAKWLALALTTMVGALNRETALLLPLAFCTHQLGRMPWRRYLLLMTGLLVAWVGVRIAVSSLLWQSPGDSLHFRLGNMHRVEVNALWLTATSDRWLLALSYFGCLPVSGLLFRKSVPYELVCLTPPAFWLVFGLLFVGNVYEPRIFGEPLVLCYPAMAVGLAHWLRGGDSVDAKHHESPNSLSL